MIRSDVEIIPMSTLLERCVENTEWFKRNFHVIAKEKKKDSSKLHHWEELKKIRSVVFEGGKLWYFATITNWNEN